jgi:MoxR-like ATPase
VDQIELLAKAAASADLSVVRPLLAHAIRMLRATGVFLTDRRAVKVQRLIAAAAVLAGRQRPTQADLWPLILAVPTREEQALARDTLRDLLAATENAALQAAAEEASLGPLARATRLAAAGRVALEQAPEASDVEAREGRRLRLEGIAREIDAGFAAEDLPAELAQVRARIVAEVAAA